MFKRLFLAISIQDTVQHQINACIKPWLVKGVRTVPPENWHVTVLFLGEIHEARIPFLEEKVSRVCTQTDSFTVTGEELVFGPPKRRPTMIWAACKANKAFEVLSRALFKSVEFMLKPGVKEDNNREIFPHITLARFRYKPHVLKSKPPIPCQFEIPVEEIILYESILNPAGVKYKRIQEFVLKQ